MQWTCKYCTFCAEKRGYLFKHYRLKHTQTSTLPCLYKDCLYTFKSFNALKVHLSMWHAQKDGGKGRKITFLCQLCDFVAPCNEVDFFTHLRRHLSVVHIRAVTLRAIFIPPSMQTEEKSISLTVR